MGLGAGLGTLAAVVVIGLLYAYWRRRSNAKDAPAKALSSSAEEGADRGAGTGAGSAAAQAGKFDTLNPFVKGAKERTLREHGAGRRVGRTAWDPAQARAQTQGQENETPLPATPQGAPGAAALVASRGAMTVRGAALAGSYADPSPQAPSAQDDEAAVGVRVREVEEEEEEDAQSDDPEQGGPQGDAASAASAAASPPPFSPPASLAVRSPLGPARGGAASRLAAAASDAKRGVQPLLAGGGSSSGKGAGATAAARAPLSALLGSPFGAVSSPFSSLPMPMPPGRGSAARTQGVAAGLGLTAPPPSQAAPLGERGEGRWANDDPLLLL